MAVEGGHPSLKSKALVQFAYVATPARSKLLLASVQRLASRTKLFVVADVGPGVTDGDEWDVRHVQGFPFAVAGGQPGIERVS